MVLVDVAKPIGQSPGAALKIKSEITLINVEDILSFPQRDENGVVLVGDIIMKPNTFAIKVYGTKSTIEIQDNSEGDPDQQGFLPQIVFSHPGNRKALLEFKANALSKDFVIVVDYCDGSPRTILGSPCEPLTMQSSSTYNNESTTNQFTFAQSTRGNGLGIYEGTLTYEEPLDVVPAGSTEIDLIGSGEYQLQGGSAVISSFTGASDSLIFTLLGATGGTAPTIASTADILLKNGETWIANAGASITFKVMKTSAGVNDFTYIEQSRYPTA
ncbi:MAG: hypothetical protein LBB41_07410 [Prevotellaceae bacterium]|jgi:hypothetical protein|nr:hypothetical protein [Prevotellaceae bacterium]